MLNVAVRGLHVPTHLTVVPAHGLGRDFGPTKAERGIERCRGKLQIIIAERISKQKLLSL